MNTKGAATILVALLLLLASVPLASAYKGHQLSRAEVVDFTLIDQDNSNFTFSQSLSDVHVIAFVFTRCPDVCPVITQSLKLVQDGLSESDAREVKFVSITVDPEYDTPEQLKSFCDKMAPFNKFENDEQRTKGKCCNEVVSHSSLSGRHKFAHESSGRFPMSVFSCLECQDNCV